MTDSNAGYRLLMSNPIQLASDGLWHGDISGE